MTISNWIIAALAFLVAIWFAVDGTIALTKGDYVTPRSGQYAGQLGPWSKVVSSVGIAPRSTLMKTVFLVYGLIWLLSIVCYLLKLPWAWGAMLVLAIGSLWYLPFGTILGVVQIILLLVFRK